MEKDIIRTWQKNAVEWINIIDTNQIVSRKFTNKAILDLVEQTLGNKVLDIGCGEGWLTRSLTKFGRKAVGLDAIEELLINAKEKSTENYYNMSYTDIMGGKTIPESPYDIAIFNFSLYQKENLPLLLWNTKKNLFDKGSIIIQTLHPFFLLKNGLEYKSQTMADSWKGLPGKFTDGHPWYARTFQDWISVLSESGLTLKDLTEITNESEEPISLVLRAI